jgi:hypothetical protein
MKKPLKKPEHLSRVPRAIVSVLKKRGLRNERERAEKSLRRAQARAQMGDTLTFNQEAPS